jgi:hypothetical protein
MTQENKELLLKDLCARLPYGVKMNHIADDEHSPKKLIGVAKDMITLEGLGGYECVDVEDYKPYLFPLSSMTEEQKKEYDSIIYHNIELHCERYYNVIDVDSFEELQEFYHKNHLDYRNLIGFGLVLDATGQNIY